MQMMSVIASNPLLNIAVISWFVAQVIKTALNWAANGHLNLERLTGSGGMPSSHSSFVVSLAIGMARVEGYQSPLFAMTLVFAAVVMYDAMGVRRAAGEQAKTLNHLIGNFQDFFEFLKDHPLLDFDDEEFSADADDDMTGENRKMLKEFLGHTPLEVLAGALLGILIAMIYPL